MSRTRHGIFKNSIKMGRESYAKFLFFLCAFLSIIAVIGIVGFIFYDSLLAFRKIGLFNFIFGSLWNPKFDKYGIAPMIVNTVAVTVCSVTFGGIVGIFCAIFLVFWCPKGFHFKGKYRQKWINKLIQTINKINLRIIFDQVLKLLAGIPSIVYGIFGMEVLVSVLSMFNGGRSGMGILASSILLSIMILPTITSLCKNALESVPQGYFEGALAMGNTKEQSVFRVVLPAAKSGIISSMILALGRAVGEAMAVIWVSGNRALYPSGLFSNIRTLATNIVMEMGYATGLHQSALFATGFVLLVFVLLITLSFHFMPKRTGKKRNKRKLLSTFNGEIFFRKKGKIDKLLKFSSVIFAFFVFATLGILVIYFIIIGISNLTPEFFMLSQRLDIPTFFPSLFATMELIIITLAIALPLGISSAIYLCEYAKTGSKIVKFIRTFIDTLSGVPSIVFGLFGMLLFRDVLGVGRNVLCGALTMVFVVLPTVIRSTEESLNAVPLSLREASYGLGAGKIRTIFRIVLPSAFSGIATACILAMGRMIGESAALIFTMGTALTFTGNPLDSASSLSVLTYYCANEGHYLSYAYVTAAILLIITFCLNLTVYLIQKRVKREK